MEQCWIQLGRASKKKAFGEIGTFGALGGHGVSLRFGPGNTRIFFLSSITSLQHRTPPVVCCLHPRARPAAHDECPACF
jgi:hypothetical protein